MKCLNNIKIGTKLIVGFIIVAMICGIVGVIGIQKINETNKNYTELYTDYGVSTGDIGNASISHQRLRINLYKIMLEKDKNKRDDYINKIKNYDTNIQENLSKFEKAIKSDDRKKELSDLRSLLDKYNIIKDSVINLSIAGKQDEAFSLITQNETQTLADDINKSIDNLMGNKISDGFNKSNVYSSEVHKAVATMIIIIIIAVIVALALGIFISRSIGKPIAKLIDATKQISNGNLDVKISSNSNDEVGVLSKSMEKMENKLNDVMENINFAAEQVTVGSKQIADSTIALSQGATEQASAVEELTASIEEISSQIKMNAENAKKANGIAESTKINAINRNDEMKLMLSAMDEINNSSNNIAKIIKVIDEIAFQTNILALNAAVEAARAGKYGKGFTVVAEEVRNLAARSANAAKETTEIIEESILKIGDGTKIANQTAEALNNIVKDVQDVAQIIGEISEASEEQATGISQISQGVVQISQVVQSNSATAEESAAASEELAGQAEVLKEQVQMFKLKNSQNSSQYIEPRYINLDSTNEQETYQKSRNSLGVYASSVNNNEQKSKRIILSDDEFGKY